MFDTSPPHPNADVRMRGFAERITVEHALAWIDGELDRRGLLGSEAVALGEAASRVLAEEIVSKVNVPDFQRAMMDGYALSAADIAAASAAQPVALNVLGDCFPGKAFSGKVGAGQAVRIMTGAQLPAGVDSVLPVELTETVDGKVCALQSLPAGKNLGSVGEDIRSGEVVLTAGRVLRPQDIGVLSSVGIGQVNVVRRPRVRVVVTGDELLPTGATPAGNQIVDANGPMLQALVARDGGIAQHPGIVPDDRDAIRRALEDESDIVVTSGGSSVGQEDHVPTLLAEFGELAVHGVSMRPAAPLGMGTYQDRIVVLLPGNPVACLWGYDLIASRAVRRLGGRPSDWPYRKTTAKLARDLKSPVGRVDYVRVQFTAGQVTPVPSSGASVLSSTTRAAGFVVVPAEADGLAAGTEVELFFYD
ncbi:MAG: molybdopterin molybdotransferase MoeA [Bythopirellula sp.]